MCIHNMCPYAVAHYTGIALQQCSIVRVWLRQISHKISKNIHLHRLLRLLTLTFTTQIGTQKKSICFARIVCFPMHRFMIQYTPRNMLNVFFFIINFCMKFVCYMCRICKLIFNCILMCLCVVQLHIISRTSNWNEGTLYKNGWAHIYIFSRTVHFQTNIEFIRKTYAEPRCFCLKCT